MVRPASLRAPQVIAHRGASGHAHENSPAAFRRAAALGAEAVELDVHATRDGVLVVYHDPVIPGLGPISRCQRADLHAVRLPNGERIPDLAEVLGICGNMDVYVEVKSLAAAFDEALLATLDAGPAPARYAVHAFDHRLIHRLAARRPSLRRGLLLCSYLVDTPAILRAAGAHHLWQEWHLIDEELVETAARAGADVIAWTVNEAPAAQRLAAMGVGGLCGNYPERLIAPAWQ